MAKNDLRNLPELEIGDEVFFGGRDVSWFADAIRWFTRAKHEDKTIAYHVGQICDKTLDLSVPLLGEALALVTIHPAWPEIKKAKRCEIWRKDDRTWSEQSRIRDYWYAVKGQPYGFWKLVPHALDGLLGKAFGGSPLVFRRLFFCSRWTVCSAHVSLAEQYATCDPRPFGKPAGEDNPDEQHDFVRSEASGWHLVWRNK